MRRSSPTSSEAVSSAEIERSTAELEPQATSERDSVIIERRQVVRSALASGGRWRRAARWIGLALFVVGAGLLAYVFWQAFQGFQNFTHPGYLSSRIRTVQGDGWQEQILSIVINIGAEVLRVLYLLLLGYLASAIAAKGIQFFSASETIIDEAVVADIE